MFFHFILHTSSQIHLALFCKSRSSTQKWVCWGFPKALFRNLLIYHYYIVHIYLMSSSDQKCVKNKAFIRQCIVYCISAPTDRIYFFCPFLRGKGASQRYVSKYSRKRKTTLFGVWCRICWLTDSGQKRHNTCESLRKCSTTIIPCQIVFVLWINYYETAEETDDIIHPKSPY